MREDTTKVGVRGNAKDLDDILTGDRIKALDRALRMLVKLDEFGVLEALEEMVNPEFLGSLAAFLINIHTLKLLDRLDDLMKAVSSVDYESLAERTDLLNEVIRSLQDKPKKVGITGLLKELRDPDVQRGLGVLVEVLRSIGKRSSE